MSVARRGHLIWFAAFTTLDPFAKTEPQLLEVKSEIDENLGEVNKTCIQVNVSDAISLGMVIGLQGRELFLKSYHSVVGAMTSPEILYKGESSVNNPPIQAEPVKEAVWCKLWNASQLLGEDILTTSTMEESRRRSARRHYFWASHVTRGGTVIGDVTDDLWQEGSCGLQAQVGRCRRCFPSPALGSVCNMCEL